MKLPEFTFDPKREFGAEQKHRREMAKREREEFELDTGMARKALRGEYGPESKLIAEKITYKGSEMGAPVLVELRMALRKVRGRISA